MDKKGLYHYFRALLKLSVATVGTIAAVLLIPDLIRFGIGATLALVFVFSLEVDLLLDFGEELAKKKDNSKSTILK